MEDDRQCTYAARQSVCATCCHLLRVQICQTADGWYKFARWTGQRSVTAQGVFLRISWGVNKYINELAPESQTQHKNYANLTQVSVFDYSRNKNVLVPSLI